MPFSFEFDYNLKLHKTQAVKNALIQEKLMLCLTFNHGLALTSLPRTQNCTVKHTANNLWQFTANHKTAGCWHIVTGLADIIPPHQVVWNCTKSLCYFHNRILLVPAFKPKCLWRLWHKASTTFRFPFTISENKTIMTFQKKNYDVEVQNSAEMI